MQVKQQGTQSMSHFIRQLHLAHVTASPPRQGSPAPPELHAGDVSPHVLQRGQAGVGNLQGSLAGGLQILNLRPQQAGVRQAPNALQLGVAFAGQGSRVPDARQAVGGLLLLGQRLGEHRAGGGGRSG